MDKIQITSPMSLDLNTPIIKVVAQTITTSNSIIDKSNREVSKAVVLKTPTILSSSLITPSKIHKEDINQERIIIQEPIVELTHRISHLNSWVV